jgi:hypothetical protein
MPTRTVTGTVRKPDGSAWASDKIHFKLDQAFETSLEVYPQEDHVVTLDAQGAFSITLGVPDTGTAAYVIRTPEGGEYTVNLASGPATDLQTLITIAGSNVPPSAVQVLLDAHVAAADPHHYLTGPVFTGSAQVGLAGTDGNRFSLSAGNPLSNTLRWNMNTAHATFNGTQDDLLFIGWNMGATGSRPENASYHHWGMAFEHDYHYTAAAGDHCSEWYTIFYNAALGERRPWQQIINHTTGAIVHTMNGNITINNSSGVPAWQFEDGGALISQGKALRNDVNGTSLIRQRKADGSGWKSILLNGADQWAIDAEITMYNDITFNHSNTTGPIIIDRTNGHQYRIKVDNGQLGVEQL